MIKQAILRLQDDCDRDVRDNSACIVSGMTRLESTTSETIIHNNSDVETEKQDVEKHQKDESSNQEQENEINSEKDIETNNLGAGGEGDNELLIRQNENSNKMELKIE